MPSGPGHASRLLVSLENALDEPKLVRQEYHSSEKVPRRTS